MRSAREELIWTVSYALWQAQGRLPKPGKRPRGWGPSLEEFKGLAEAVIDHMELSGYEVTHKPAMANHSTPGR